MRPTSRYLALIGLLWLAAPVGVAAQTAAPDATEIAIPYRPEIGGRSKLTIVEEEDRHKGGGLQSTSRTTTTIVSEVIGRQADGYAVRWTFGRPIHDKRVRLRTQPELARLPDGLFDAERAVGGMQLEVQVDEHGRPVRILNLEHARKHIADGLERALQRDAGGADENSMWRGARKLMVSQTRAALRRVRAMPERRFRDEYIPGYPLPYRVRTLTYRVGETIDVVESPKPCGKTAPPLAPLRTRVLDYDPGAGLARIEWRRDQDPDSYMQTMIAISDCIAEKAGRAKPAGPAMDTREYFRRTPVVAVTERWEFAANAKTGRVASAIGERVYETSESKDVRRWRVTSTPLP